MGPESPHFKPPVDTERLGNVEDEKLNSPNREAVEALNSVVDTEDLTKIILSFDKEGFFIPKDTDETAEMARGGITTEQLLENISDYVNNRTDKLKLPIMLDRTLHGALEDAAERVRKPQA